ncbi:predicted protein [Bathycoccus prasinos]|uniref:Uncharacterized protein n=1 Tax=Bathycoccus prasinos TaxID=41875 RepID=K8F3T8_9CHLO|nr:predicted protein [Bathycoccus prasinos]CCO66722.1 predicted protein [Bathycoccus prasinos]|eukprot:XP_007511162.1 predicted protein [Bathycoccus prasinos]
MTAIDFVLNRNMGLTSAPEKINRYYALTFATYAMKPVFALLSDWFLSRSSSRDENDEKEGETTRRRERGHRAKFASGCCILAGIFQFALSFAKTLKEVYGFGILMTACVSGAYASLDGILVCAAKGTKTIETTTSGRNEEEMRRMGGGEREGGGEINAEEEAEEVRAIEERENNAHNSKSKNRRITQVNVQTVAMATRTFAAILGSACSVLFLEMFTARATIALSSGFAVLASIFALRIQEGKRSAGGAREVDEDLETRRRRRRRAQTSTKKWPWRRFFSDREFIVLALALFIYRITPTAMDTYNSFIYSIYDKKLPNSAFGMFQFFSNVGALFGAFAFSFFHNKYFVEKKQQQRDDGNLPPHSPPGRIGELPSSSSSSRYANARIRQKQLLLQTPRSKMNVFLLGGVADVGFQLVRLFALYHPPQINQRNSGMRAAIILSILELVISFGSRFAYMPIVILSAVVAEKCESKEAFSFSALVFFADLSSIFAGFIAADIVERWKIGAAVKRKLDMMYITGRSWRPLKNFVYLCAFLKLSAVAVTLLLLKLILSRSSSSSSSSPSSSSSSEEDEDEENENEEAYYETVLAPAATAAATAATTITTARDDDEYNQFSPYRIDR